MDTHWLTALHLSAALHAHPVIAAQSSLRETEKVQGA